MSYLVSPGASSLVRRGWRVTYGDCSCEYFFLASHTSQNVASVRGPFRIRDYVGAVPTPRALPRRTRV